MKLILCDISSQLCYAWDKFFKWEEDVVIMNKSFEDVEEYDCIVSPANSFGLMDGGIDKAITNYFGLDLMKRVQQSINVQYYGEQPVGTSLIVETGNAKHPYLAHTPTMRIPKDINGTDNVYNAMRAMLIATIQHGDIKSVLCPGLGTLTGQMKPVEAAWQMYLAYQHIQKPFPINWAYATFIDYGVTEWGDLFK